MSDTATGDNDHVSTLDAIQRSRDFMEAKLIPDMEEASAHVAHLEANLDDYLRLQEDLQVVKSSLHIKTTGTKDGEEEKDGSPGFSTLAHLGQGINIPVEIESNALLLVSLGLKESHQDWKSSSGLYLEMSRAQADSFSKKKVDILAK
jgi:prefoldin subunit 5